MDKEDEKYKDNDKDKGHLHLYEVGSEPVYDLQVGGEVLVAVEVVLVGLLLVPLQVEDGADLLEDARVRGYQA